MCWLNRYLVRALVAALLGLLLGQALPVLAGSAEVRTAEVVQRDDGVTLTGSFALTLSPALVDAVDHGIPLVFQMEAEIKRPRWYWTDETLYQARVDRRLIYNALVRNYRVSEEQTGHNFAELADALAYIARPAEWPLPRGLARTGEVIDVAIRFRLDPNFLPKPFQVVSFGDQAWRLDSDWRYFHLTVPAVSGRP